MRSLESVLLEKLNQLIEDNLNNTSYSTDNICRDLGVSRSQLYRMVKEHSQLSTALYIRKRKLIKSKDLLENSDMKIAEIAYFIGIDSPQNFSKYFTHEFGISPTEFRKNQATFEGDSITQTIDNEIVNKNILTPKKQRKYTYLWTGLGVLLLIILGIYFWQNNKKTSTDNTTKLSISTKFSENSIAILPFKNLGESKNSFFCEGIMEQIHGSLASINDLKVISTTSSNKYLNTQKTISQIASELHVNYVLEGSVLQFQNQVKISVELINAKDDRVIWTKNIEGKTNDIFVLMNSVSKEVAGELNQKLGGVLNKKSENIPTKSLAAYNEYLQGIQLSKTRNKEKLAASIKKFDNAIEFDPTFAAAYAEKANAYWLNGDGRYVEVELAEKMAEKNALIAIRLDAENSLAYGTLANIYRSRNKWEQANTTYQIALKYSPNDALINYWYSLMLRSLGRMDEAIKYSTKAVEIDPLYHVIMGGHAVNCIFGNRFDLAQKSIKDGELLFNDSWVYYLVKGYYNYAKEDYETAMKELNKSHELNPSVKTVEYQIIYCKAKLGQVKEVNDYLKTLADIPENYTAFTIIYAGLGDKERSMSYLQKNAALGVIPTDLKVQPFYKILHNDRRYEAVLQKFGLLEGGIDVK
jgi:TolB-like protein/AraC-like DNA-binding protein/tetratricopeptide (TPR) repeat protein